MITFPRLTRRSILAALLTVAFSTLLAVPAFADKAKPIPLDDAAKADIARIETYLNGIKTLRTRFLQIADGGQTASGVLTISRPGKMRFEYDPPSQQMLIADGTFLIYIDQALEQVTHVFLKNTPVGVLVAANIKLSGAVTVTGFSHGPGVIRVALTKTDDPDEGSITLAFSDSPMALRQWTVLDSQGSQTTVTLDDLNYGVPVDDKMFHYSAPIRDASPRDR